MTVYGPMNHDLTTTFLDELGSIYRQAVLPTIIGGDFNLIRDTLDKNSDNIDFRLIDQFNSFIGDHQLRKLKRSG